MKSKVGIINILTASKKEQMIKERFAQNKNPFFMKNYDRIDGYSEKHFMYVYAK